MERAAGESWIAPPPVRQAGLRLVEPPAESRTFDELFRAYGKDIYRFVVSRVRDPYLASDVVQETFLRAYRARDAFDPHRPMWPWLATIARNLVLNVRRDQRRSRRYVHDALDWDEVALQPESRLEADPEKSYTVAQERAAIASALRSLSPCQQRVLRLRAVEGLSYESIALREGISIDAVKSRLKRARKAFRRAYKDT